MTADAAPGPPRRLHPRAKPLGLDAAGDAAWQPSPGVHRRRAEPERRRRSVTYRCSCGELLRACRFWRTITARLARARRAVRRPGGGHRLPRVPSRYVRRLLRPLHRGPTRGGGPRRSRSDCSPGVARGVSRTSRRAIAPSSTRSAPTGADGDRRLLEDRRAAEVPAPQSGSGRPGDSPHSRRPRGGGQLHGSGGVRRRARPARCAAAVPAASRDHERLPVEAAAREWRRSHEEAEAIVRRLDTSRWMRSALRGALRRHRRDAVRRCSGSWASIPAPRAATIGNRTITSSATACGSTRRARWLSTVAGRRSSPTRDRRAFDAVAGDLNRRYGYAG